MDEGTRIFFVTSRPGVSRDVGDATMKPQTSLIAPSNVYSDQSFESWMKDGSHFDFIGQKREKLTLN